MDLPFLFVTTAAKVGVMPLNIANKYPAISATLKKAAAKSERLLLYNTAVLPCDFLLCTFIVKRYRNRLNIKIQHKTF